MRKKRTGGDGVLGIALELLKYRCLQAESRSVFDQRSESNTRGEMCSPDVPAVNFFMARKVYSPCLPSFSKSTLIHISEELLPTREVSLQSIINHRVPSMSYGGATSFRRPRCDRLIPGSLIRISVGRETFYQELVHKVGAPAAASTRHLLRNRTSFDLDLSSMS